jgi:tRNA1Val (adenine37-N6)-methyltransferase
MCDAIKSKLLRFMNMKDEFCFKHFSVKQDRCAMKVGTDGVLLGCWAEGGENILDIGTGTGLIAMMMAQRFPNARFDALEIDGLAAGQALENVVQSPFKERVFVIKESLQEYSERIGEKSDSVEGKYDAIVSNPPYFINSLKNPNAERAKARHTDTLSYADLFSGVVRLLKADGVFSAIVPVECEESFCSEAFLRGLFLTRKYMVRTVERKMPKRCLLAFSKQRSVVIDNMDVYLQNPDGSRSAWFNEKSLDFYL